MAATAARARAARGASARSVASTKGAERDGCNTGATFQSPLNRGERVPILSSSNSLRPTECRRQNDPGRGRETHTNLATQHDFKPKAHPALRATYGRLTHRKPVRLPLFERATYAIKAKSLRSDYGENGPIAEKCERVPRARQSRTACRSRSRAYHATNAPMTELTEPCSAAPADGDASPVHPHAAAHASARAGLGYALAAYLAWGFVPAYFKLLAHVSPLVVLCHRVVWSVLFLAGLIAVQRRGADVWACARRRPVIL